MTRVPVSIEAVSEAHSQDKEADWMNMAAFARDTARLAKGDKQQYIGLNSLITLSRRSANAAAILHDLGKINRAFQDAFLVVPIGGKVGGRRLASHVGNASRRVFADSASARQQNWVEETLIAHQSALDLRDEADRLVISATAHAQASKQKGDEIDSILSQIRSLTGQTTST